ncbi:MAG: 3-methyladenine DNA glycosylase [Deltaproteobacteria bacterium HGW-Deltaproteobacteria-2]|jgi:DNA-3-methyladenine glycosylase|nr:MAG: 3-methyladenine DNA glycosylase [Deltaproteobacteria bacterium HGW-Deltaproteobacteria-2]
MNILDRKFYRYDTLKVARALLGKKLVRQIGDLRLSGMVVETEAYCGREDSACHAHRGKTLRNAMMFGEPGHAYIYFTYGMHYMLNLVTEDEGSPCAVLIRAVVPLAGIEEMEDRRKRKGADLTNGPAKLCQAFSIDKALNGWDLTRGEELWVEDYKIISTKSIITTPRIGIDYSKKTDREALWRFLIKTEEK